MYMTNYVYGIIDPDTDNIVYIGVTTNILTRVRCHWHCKDGRPISVYMASLKERGIFPKWEILWSQKVPFIGDHNRDRPMFLMEKQLIKEYKNNGFKLLNKTHYD